MKTVKKIRTILKKLFKKDSPQLGDTDSQHDWSKKQIVKMAELGGRLVL